MTATVRFNGKNMRAQQLLDLASKQILDFTEESLTLPPICCAPTYVPRAAFEGDDVGVPLADRAAALAENAAAAANYSTNSTKSIPYGVCKTTYSWRQAYMGDYVCVNSSQLSQVAVDDASFRSHVGICPPSPSRPTAGRGFNTCY